MSGPEHYREAERLLERHTKALDQVKQMVTASSSSPEVAAAAVAVANSLVTCAQVHATLALAAATAYDAARDYTGDEDGSLSRGWAGVA